MFAQERDLLQTCLWAHHFPRFTSRNRGLLGFALLFGAWLFDFRFEPQKMRKRAEGIHGIKAGLKVWDTSGGGVRTPYLRTVLAKGMARLDDLDGALELVDKSIAQIERPGWEERVCYAGILRLKGKVFSLKDGLEGAERNYLASLYWAREQQAKSWELRASTSLARQWQAQGKRKQALELLAPISVDIRDDLWRQNRLSKARRASFVLGLPRGFRAVRVFVPVTKELR